MNWRHSLAVILRALADKLEPLPELPIRAWMDAHEAEIRAVLAGIARDN